MDLTSAITGLQQAKTIGNIQIAVAKKVLDSQKQQGNAALQLVAAATGQLDQAASAVVSATTSDLGGSFDAYA